MLASFLPPFYLDLAIKSSADYTDYADYQEGKALFFLQMESAKSV
jgi:hypothetical protein